MSTDSHVQIPRQILRRFMDDYKVAYLDLKCNKIKYKGPNKLDTENGYYSSTNEDYLAQNVEDSYGKISIPLLNFYDNIGNMSISPEMEANARKFLTFSFLRSNYAKFLIRSRYLTFLSDREQDFLINFGRDTGVTLFSDLKLNIIINTSSLGFVVPRSCWYEVLSSGVLSIVMPISPKSAFIFVPPGEHSLHINGNNLEYGKIDSESKVERINEYALNYEYVYNKGFIASVDMHELQRLQMYLVTNQEKYDEQRRSILGLIN